MTEAGTIPALDVPGRLERLGGVLETEGMAALLVTELSNVRYLTGFSGSAGVLIVGPGTALLVTDGRYRTQAGEELAKAGVDVKVDLVIGGVEAQREAVAERGRGLDGLQVGFESEHLSWGAVERWRGAFRSAGVLAELAPANGLVEKLRIAKDAGEIARMEQAAEIADAALAEVLPTLGDGRTESEIALALDTAMRKLGAEGVAFETIVASGPNAAKPHARPSDRLVRGGDPVVIDFGAVFEGYRSDMTRTFCVGGPPTGDLARVSEVVTSAQSAGVAKVSAGVEASEVDRACRDLIAAAGWAEAFEHGTGHGVGLDVHEEPGVGPKSTAILAAHNVVTVEPGVYLEGIGGVRVEDTVVVTEDGCRVLTKFPKEIIA